MHAEPFDRDHHHRYSAWDRASSRFRAYVRTRRSEHWVMFLAGPVIGLILG